VIREKFLEIKDEIHEVSRGKMHIIETFVPIMIFLLLVSSVGIKISATLSAISGFVFFLRDLLRRRFPWYSLGGLGVLLVVIIAVIRTGQAGRVLLPGIGSNGLIFFLCFLSLPFKRPFVAWASYFARHYPLQWYWHPRVRPAYTEVTILWAVFFGCRMVLQILLMKSTNAFLVLVFAFLSGWPSTLAVLIFSYFYGTWRLRNLKGPSSEEFRNGDPPPWDGQKRGF